MTGERLTGIQKTHIIQRNSNDSGAERDFWEIKTKRQYDKISVVKATCNFDIRRGSLKHNESEIYFSWSEGQLKKIRLLACK